MYIGARARRIKSERNWRPLTSVENGSKTLKGGRARSQGEKDGERG